MSEPDVDSVPPDPQESAVTRLIMTTPEPPVAPAFCWFPGLAPPPAPPPPPPVLAVPLVHPPAAFLLPEAPPPPDPPDPALPPGASP